jgi:hypothetical protein
MKSSNQVCLGLEVLEDRLALSGAFLGAASAGVPFPLNALAANLPALGQPTPTSNIQPSNSVQTFQSQLQAFQAAQTAMIDQFFSEMQTWSQILNLHTFVIL